MENKTKLVVLGLIKNDKNQYLLSQRYDLDVPEAHLKWDLVGGTNEFGEDLEETLCLFLRNIYAIICLYIQIYDQVYFSRRLCP